MLLAPRLLCCLASLLAVPATTQAQEGPLGRLELSARLQTEGQAQGDPLLFLAAARLRHGLTLLPADGEAADWPTDWPALLEAARQAAAGDPALLALIEATAADLAAEGARGVTTGQVYSIARLAAGESDSYPALPFDAGAYAEVYAEVDPGTGPDAGPGGALGLQVFDNLGRLVCADPGPAPVVYCGWRPVEAGSFTIRIDNAGPGPTRYLLMTN